MSKTLILTATLLLGLTIGPAAAAASDSETNRPRFAIYMPKLDVYSGTLDVTDRINSYLLKVKPSEIPLAAYPIISEEDVLGYDWDTHTLHLRHSIWFKIREPGVHGVPFVVVADGEPLYTGAFWTCFSSISTPMPVVMWDYERKSKSITIEAGYPGGPEAGKRHDPRANERLKRVLSDLGKIKPAEQPRRDP